MFSNHPAGVTWVGRGYSTSFCGLMDVIYLIGRFLSPDWFKEQA